MTIKGLRELIKNYPDDMVIGFSLELPDVDDEPNNYPESPDSSPFRSMSMKKLRLKDSTTSCGQPPGVARIVRVMAEAGYEIAPATAVRAWGADCEEQESSSWVNPDDYDDDVIVESMLRQCEVDPDAADAVRALEKD